MVLTVFATGVGTGGPEIVQQIQRQAPSQPRRVKHAVLDGDDAGIRAGEDELAIQLIGGFAPEWLDGDEVRPPNRAARVLGGYTLLGRQVDVVETSRGCTFDCSFCSIIEMRGRNFHTFDFARVLADIRDARAHGARAVFLVDDNITLNVRRFEALCRAIVEAGFLLQIDAPDLAMERHTLFHDKPLADFLAFVRLVVAAIGEALAGLPRDRVRLHVCWGNYEGPHDLDVPLEDIWPEVARAEAEARDEKRWKRIEGGAGDLERWLGDVVHRGLASATGADRDAWIAFAARMVDAQAPGPVTRPELMTLLHREAEKVEPGPVSRGEFCRVLYDWLTSDRNRKPD